MKILLVFPIAISLAEKSKVAHVFELGLSLFSP